MTTSNHKEVTRTCCVCHKQMDKRNLLRIVKVSDSLIEADLTGKKNGRGTYVCNSAECIQSIANSNAIEHSLRIKLSSDVKNNVVMDLMNRLGGM